MPRNNIAGAQAASIEFRNLTGAAPRSPILQGDVVYTPQQSQNEPIEDVHTAAPIFRKKVISGHRITATFALDEIPSWLNGDTVADADLQIRFLNGRILTATGVTLAAEPTENNLTAGTTNERTFHAVSATFVE